MPFSESQIPGLRICMGMFAACAFAIGVVMSVDGHTSLALTNFCGASFFLFAYHNPHALITQQINEPAVDDQEMVETKFLWVSLSVGLLAVLIEFQEYLPLG